MIWFCPGKIVRPFLSAYKTPFTLGVIDLLPDSALLRLDLLQRRLEKQSSAGASLCEQRFRQLDQPPSTALGSEDQLRTMVCGAGRVMKSPMR